ncbi:MAG: hypothetical protein VYC71_07715, partial [Planctomycetota bacterium]|nr:hypothetical protein [Planctomycetota bacterium]
RRSDRDDGSGEDPRRTSVAWAAIFPVSRANLQLSYVNAIADTAAVGLSVLPTSPFRSLSIFTRAD